MNTFKTGYVSIIGRPNVGKSTLLNHLLEQKISIVTRKPQTTRWNLQGIKTTAIAQIIFIDTPGLQKQSKLALNRHMNKEVSNSIEHIDIILFVVAALKWNELDENVIALLKKKSPKNLFLVINKIDKVLHKNELLSYIKTVSNRFKFHEIIPVSAIKGTGLSNLERLITINLPIAPPLFPKSQVATRNERFFVAEFIREQLILRLNDELPYRISVTIEAFTVKRNIVHIHACIWVEKKGQKRIIIGKEGRVLKAAGTAARQALEVFLDKKVNLKTWVKVEAKWANSEQALKKFGYFE